MIRGNSDIRRNSFCTECVLELFSFLSVLADWDFGVFFVCFCCCSCLVGLFLSVLRAYTNLQEYVTFNTEFIIVMM